jgi:5-methyltetrahydropteroyltriglutamate--homocysteine methyltransferase
MTIPAPSTLHFRQGRQSIDKQVYPDIEGYFHDVGLAYQKAIRRFYDAGCRYLQLDDTAWSMICDPKEREFSRQRGDDPDRLPAQYARMTNQALAGRPADMVVTMHSCRGNFRSTFIAQGGYEHVADRLLGRGRHRRLFPGIRHRSRRRLRAAALRAQGQEAGRARPRHLEERHAGKKDDIKRRIDEATKYVDIDQLCLSPQCGFASTEEGNVLAEDEQWAKLRMIVELADEVWGR